MISLAQLLIAGVAGFMFANAVARDRARGASTSAGTRGSRWSSRCSSRRPLAFVLGAAGQPDDRHLLPDADPGLRGHRLLGVCTGDDDLRPERHQQHRRARALRRPLPALPRRRGALGPRLPGLQGASAGRTSVWRCRVCGTTRCAWAHSASTWRCTGRSPSPSPGSSPGSPVCSTSGGADRSTPPRISIGPTLIAADHRRHRRHLVLRGRLGGGAGLRPR